MSSAFDMYILIFFCMEEEYFPCRTIINVLKTLIADHDFFSKDEDLSVNVQVYLFAFSLFPQLVMIMIGAKRKNA